jgi:hypothetical protein
MRACEGCRRRKIKCDSATTNTWPCAACTRLKLQCVPPSVSYEKDSDTPGTHTFELQRSQSFPQVDHHHSLGEFHHQVMHSQFANVEPTLHPGNQGASYSQFRAMPPDTYIEPTTEPETLHYQSIPQSMPQSSIPRDSNTPVIYPTPQSLTAASMTESVWDNQSTVSNLADAFGDLQIDLAAVGRFLAGTPLLFPFLITSRSTVYSGFETTCRRPRHTRV